MNCAERVLHSCWNCWQGENHMPPYPFCSLTRIKGGRVHEVVRYTRGQQGLPLQEAAPCSLASRCPTGLLRGGSPGHTLVGGQKLFPLIKSGFFFPSSEPSLVSCVHTDIPIWSVEGRGVSVRRTRSTASTTMALGLVRISLSSTEVFASQARKEGEGAESGLVASEWDCRFKSKSSLPGKILQCVCNGSVLSNARGIARLLWH